MLLPAQHTRHTAPKPRTVHMCPRPKPAYGTGHWSTGTLELWRRNPNPQRRSWILIETAMYNNRHERRQIIERWKRKHYRPFEIRIIPNA